MEIILRHTLVVIGFLLAVLIVARLLKEHRAPGNTMAWLLAIILIPYIGVPLYLTFGGRKIGRVAKHREPVPLEVPRSLEFVSRAEHVLCATGIPQSRDGNHITMLPDGVSAYRDLVNMIQNAKTSLNIATFILGKDEVGAEIVRLLAEKARSGVKVRLLLDALGCIWTSRSFVAPIIKAGGEVGIFLPMIPYRRKWSANLRNHRKIWMADDKMVIIGGRNIAAEYMGPKSLDTQWPDFSLRIEGPAVTDLCEVFSSDWEFATKKVLKPTKDIAPSTLMPTSRLQVVADGPDTASDSLYQGVLASIVGAEKRLWIVTPYFIPDETFVRALTLAAQLGRDVRILVPIKSNHTLADFARGSYLRELSRKGVKCIGYPGMFHTKLLLVDNHIAVAGSANMDMRSLYLNFEIAAFLYSPDSVGAIETHMATMFAKSAPLELEEKTRGDHARIWFEDISRLFAPLL